MADVRGTNTSCLVCSVKTPLKVNLRKHGDYHEFVCPKCGTTIAEGVIATDGNPVSGHRIPPSVCSSVDVEARVSWDTWEAWWTDRQTACAIHGRLVGGSSKLLSLVEKLYEIYDS